MIPVTRLHLVCLVLTATYRFSLAEVRLVCPRPQSPKSDNTQGPCDPAVLSGDGDVTDVSPGPLTVRWEDTVFRQGAPSRIALGSRSQNTTCILLDQIPHNDNQFLVKGDSCATNDYPIGECRRSMTSITVNIPDVECDDCYLQLMSVDISSLTSDTEACVLGQDNSNCTFYFSCANINIRPSRNGEGNSLDTCAPYPDNLDGSWPFLTTRIYGVGPNFEQFFARNVVEYRGQTLTYDIQLPLGLATSDVVEGSEGLYDVNTALPGRIITRRSPQELIFQGSTELTEAFLRNRLLSGRLGIGLRTVGEGLIIFPLELKSLKYADGEYRSHTASFSSRGLLRANEPAFSTSSYLTPFLQAGPCAMNTRSFAALLSSSESLPQGLVTMKTLGYRAVVTGILPVTTMDVNQSNLSVSLTGNSGNGMENRRRIASRFVSLEGDNVDIEAITDIEEFLLSSSGNLPDLAEAVISSPNNTRTYEGAFENSVTAVVRDETGEMTGLVSIRFGNRDTLDTTLLLTNFSILPQVGGLFGPALPGRIGNPLSLPTFNTTVRRIGVSGYIVQSQIGITSAQLVRYFWSGQLYFDVRRNAFTPARSITAQLSDLDRQVCEGSSSKACLVTELQVEGFNRMQSMVATNAFVALVPDDAGNVDFSIIIRDLEPNETVTRLGLRNDNIGTVEDYLPTLVPSATESNALEGQGSFPMGASDRMSLILSTSRYPEGNIVGRVPSMDPQATITEEVTTQSTTIAQDVTTQSSTIAGVSPASTRRPVMADDFSISCGSRESGPMRVFYQRSFPSPGSVYAERLLQSCAFVNTTAAWILLDARQADGVACGIQESRGADWVSYSFTAIVQENPLVQTDLDTRVSLSCNFTGPQADGGVVVATGSLNVLSKPALQKQEVIRGRVDQAYRLQILNNELAVNEISQAMIGDEIVLAVTMSGTDLDEQSLRVRQCTASDPSGSSVVFLDNYCSILSVVLPEGSGFITSGTRSVLGGLKAFRLPNAPGTLITFSCIVETCTSVQQCNGRNCNPGTLRRRRQTSTEEGAELRLATQIRIGDGQNFDPANEEKTSAQIGGQWLPSEWSLLIAIAVISCLLIVTTVISVVVFCRLRQLKSKKILTSSKTIEG